MFAFDTRERSLLFEHAYCAGRIQKTPLLTQNDAVCAVICLEYMNRRVLIKLGSCEVTSDVSTDKGN